MIKLFLNLLFALLSLSVFASNGFDQIEISGGWKIKELVPTPELSAADISSIDKSDGWIPVKTMPAMVHDILMQNGLMEPHYQPGVAEKYLWVAESDWVYSTTFQATDTKEISFLNFKGLDCLVDIYLNNERIASACNMFYPLRVDVTGKLKQTNKLWIHFHSIFDLKDGKVSRKKSFREMDVRRSGQGYSKYLGANPYFSRFGVYDKIMLETTKGSELTSVMAGTQLNNALNEGKLIVDIEGTSNLNDVIVKVDLFDANKVKAAEINQKIDVQSSTFKKQIEINIGKPNLWWPRGYGDQNLYTAVITLYIKGKEHQKVTKTIGFRKVTQSSLLHFEVNNIPIKLWGGDWVATHLHTAVYDSARVEKLLKMAEIANFNAFRVWGDMEAPDDRFYELCDQKGFMLWQDFTYLPLDSGKNNINICKQEAPLQIKRLKNHPSIWVWNGGNENALWYHEEYNGQMLNRGEWPGIKPTNEIAKILQELDPDRYFQPTSPWLGVDPNDPRKGTTHGYTNMWYVPGYDYLNFVPEDTRIAAPVLQSCEKFMAKEDIWPSTYTGFQTPENPLPFPETWMKYTAGESEKKTGPIEQFYDATNIEQLIYRLGMAEGLYYQDVIERQRRGRPATDTTDNRLCGGYLVWKFNDSWPQVYSAKVDYFLEPYHCYYTLKRAFEPVMLSFEVGSCIWLWAVNDSREMVKGKVTIELFHLDKNKIRKTIDREVEVLPGKSLVVVQLDEAGIGSFRREHILHASLKDASGTKIAETFALGNIERNVTFPDAKIAISLRNGNLVLKSDQYAHAVTLEGNNNGDKSGFLFSDNYFEMLPNEEKVVEILGDKLNGNITAKAWYSKVSTNIEWQRTKANIKNIKQ